MLLKGACIASLVLSQILDPAAATVEVVVARSKKVRLLEFNELFLINAINKESAQFPHIDNASMH
jgi:hypothetical protein